MKHMPPSAFGSTALTSQLQTLMGVLGIQVEFADLNIAELDRAVRDAEARP